MKRWSRVPGKGYARGDGAFLSDVATAEDPESKLTHADLDEYLDRLLDRVGSDAQGPPETTGYEPKWKQMLSGAWINRGRVLLDRQLWQTIDGDWDPKLRDEFLDREWDRVQGELNRPIEASDPQEPDPSEQASPGLLFEPATLRQWWMETASGDCTAAAAKLGEYGSFDLLVVGQMLAHMAGWDDATDAQLTELGTWFYLCGKIARGYDAVREHRLPSDDTVHDIKVYATMIERIRQHGSWA